MQPTGLTNYRPALLQRRRRFILWKKQENIVSYEAGLIKISTVPGQNGIVVCNMYENGDIKPLVGQRYAAISITDLKVRPRFRRFLEPGKYEFYLRAKNGAPEKFGGIGFEVTLDTNDVALMLAKTPIPPEPVIPARMVKLPADPDIVRAVLTPPPLTSSLTDGAERSLKVRTWKDRKLSRARAYCRLLRMRRRALPRKGSMLMVSARLQIKEPELGPRALPPVPAIVTPWPQLECKKVELEVIAVNIRTLPPQQVESPEITAKQVLAVMRVPQPIKLKYVIECFDRSLIERSERKLPDVGSQPSQQPTETIQLIEKKEGEIMNGKVRSLEASGQKLLWLPPEDLAQAVAPVIYVYQILVVKETGESVHTKWIETDQPEADLTKVDPPLPEEKQLRIFVGLKGAPEAELAHTYFYIRNQQAKIGALEEKPSDTAPVIEPVVSESASPSQLANEPKGENPTITLKEEDAQVTPIPEGPAAPTKEVPAPEKPAASAAASAPAGKALPAAPIIPTPEPVPVKKTVVIDNLHFIGHVLVFDSNPVVRFYEIFFSEYSNELGDFSPEAKRCVVEKNSFDLMGPGAPTFSKGTAVSTYVRAVDEADSNILLGETSHDFVFYIPEGSVNPVEGYPPAPAAPEPASKPAAQDHAAPVKPTPAPTKPLETEQPPPDQSQHIVGAIREGFAGVNAEMRNSNAALLDTIQKNNAGLLTAVQGIATQVATTNTANTQALQELGRSTTATLGQTADTLREVAELARRKPEEAPVREQERRETRKTESHQLTLVGWPLVVLIAFLVCIVLFCLCRTQNGNVPQTSGPSETEKLAREVLANQMDMVHEIQKNDIGKDRQIDDLRGDLFKAQQVAATNALLQGNQGVIIFGNATSNVIVVANGSSNGVGILSSAQTCPTPQCEFVQNPVISSCEPATVGGQTCVGGVATPSCVPPAQFRGYIGNCNSTYSYFPFIPPPVVISVGGGHGGGGGFHGGHGGGAGHVH